MQNTVAIRVDVDTSVGLKKGVPKLLEIFSRFNVAATFFIVMGPDTMGKHISRFKKKGYFKRIWKVNPFKLIKNYGIAPFFYGTLLPSPKVGEDNPALLERIVSEGHEVGVHSYNHAEWADEYQSKSVFEFSKKINTGCSVYEHIYKESPKSFAAPNWRCNVGSLEAEEEYNFLYASDTRGVCPFFPVVNNKVFKTLQIPPTLPTTHECLQAKVASKNNVIEYIVNKMGSGVNVFNIHDWYEGLNEGGLVEEFIKRCIDREYHFRKMCDIASTLLLDRESIPVCSIFNRRIEGGIGEVACQKA